MAAILASQWFIPTIVTSAAVIIGQLGAIDGHLPETYHTPTAHLVRVHLGMGGDGWNGTDMGGVPPRIDLYDAWGQRLSHDYTKKTPILEGGFQDYMIEPDEEHNNRRAAYIRVGAGDYDGICIAGISIKYPDEDKAIIFGDIPHKTCGWRGYNSMSQIKATDKETATPYCFWLDDNNSYYFTPIAATFHIDDFSGQNETTQAYMNNTDLICDSSPKLSRWFAKKGDAKPGVDDRIPIFATPLKYGRQGGFENGTSNHLDPKLVLNKLQNTPWAGSWTQKDHDENPAEYPKFDDKKWDINRLDLSDIDGPIGGPPDRRDVEKKRTQRAQDHKRRFGDKWIMSNENWDHHKATAVCANEWTWGPHWASSHEQKFCNVADLTVWPFCTDDKEHNDAGCFDPMIGQLSTPNLPDPNIMLVGGLEAAAPAATMSVLNLTLRNTIG